MVAHTIGSTNKLGKTRKGSNAGDSTKTVVSNFVVSDTESDVKVETPRSSRRCKAPRRVSSASHNGMKHYVEHNYHDHKHDPVEYNTPPSSLSIVDGESFPKRTGHKGGVSTPFPEKLHELLESADRNGQNDVVGWQPHGRCFVIHKPKEFVSDVMPK
jgi:hypothetical protein